jgi:hypothetical protein
MTTARLGSLVLALIIVACDAEVEVRPGDSTREDTAPAGTDNQQTPGEQVDDSPIDTSNGSNTSNDDDEKPSTTKEATIRVTTPRAGTVITSRTFELRGESRTFENTGVYRLRADDTTVLAEGFFTATGEMGTFSPYATQVQITRAYTGGATLEVFQNSAKDGSEIDKVRIPLTIRIAEAAGDRGMSVYFTNSVKNPGASDCSRVYPVSRRVAGTSAVARAALDQLLRGPTADEARQGYGTEIPRGTTLRDVRIEGGTATADFSAELNRAAGSCSVTAARAQIERTLRQFSSVKSVVIAVNGDSREVLQP